VTTRIEHLPVEVEGSRATGWWGMVLFVVTELALFGSALASYFYLRFQSPTWPPPGIEKPDLFWGSIATVLLLSSSIPVYLGERSIERGNLRGLQIGLAVAIALAIAFLAIQAHEYASATFSWRDDAYGSLFFTITGLHGLHVIGGILVLAFLELRAARRTVDAEHHLAVTTGALYWHFVDVVWIVIFPVVYLIK
jgi:heme/copper-type cytochrome/quinol oxidase subunit 3